MGSFYFFAFKMKLSVFIAYFFVTAMSQYQHNWPFESWFNQNNYQQPPTTYQNQNCPYMIQSMMPRMTNTNNWIWNEWSVPNFSYQTIYSGNTRQRKTHGCRGCGPNCVAHCSCPEMARVRAAMAMGLPMDEVLRIGAHP